ncbi:ATPase [Paraburkholderia bonniea]|uniref:ATPase n=1 Tax=Paraburkholderia bonniea TaxID=2152891 RepID=UPI001290C3E0|nr:ATPase [Paraburkholderia bonniea]WJF89547.1 ATPase [Paraburkholderia bonniea]WJF92861.1 ATPase [Paraburkholderia bonniea]
MLTELETLSQNIGRLISISRQHHEARVALEAQLAHKQAECVAARAELEQIRAERDTLQAERDTLSAKIDDAQVRLNAILEKLPHSKNTSGTDHQLDLLAPSQQKNQPDDSASNPRSGAQS